VRQIRLAASQLVAPARGETGADPERQRGGWSPRATTAVRRGSSSPADAGA